MSSLEYKSPVFDALIAFTLNHFVELCNQKGKSEDIRVAFDFKIDGLLSAESKISVTCKSTKGIVDGVFFRDTDPSTKFEQLATDAVQEIYDIFQKSDFSRAEGLMFFIDKNHIRHRALLFADISPFKTYRNSVEGRIEITCSPMVEEKMHSKAAFNKPSATG